jgi:hypothetical protein
MNIFNNFNEGAALAKLRPLNYKIFFNFLLKLKNFIKEKSASPPPSLCLRAKARGAHSLT